MCGFVLLTKLLIGITADHMVVVLNMRGCSLMVDYGMDQRAKATALI